MIEKSFRHIITQHVPCLCNRHKKNHHNLLIKTTNTLEHTHMHTHAHTHTHTHTQAEAGFIGHSLNEILAATHGWLSLGDKEYELVASKKGTHKSYDMFNYLTNFSHHSIILFIYLFIYSVFQSFYFKLRLLCSSH